MKRSNDIAWSQVKVGIFIVTALLFFAAGVLMMGQKTKFFMPKGKLTVTMTDASGLKTGAPVWLAGVDVGIVRSIGFTSPEKSNEVQVSLEIDKDALRKIGRDSRITIKTRGLLGEKYVDITPSRTVQETPETTIVGAPTVKLDDVMQKAGTTFDRLNGIVDRIERGEGSLGRVSRDPQLYDNLVSLTSELQVFARSANRGEGTLGQLSRNSEAYDRLISILTRTEETIKDIQSADGTLGRLVRDRQLYDKLVALADKSIEAAEDVRELNRKLTSSDSTIGKLLGERDLYDRGIALIDRAENSVKGFEDIAGRLNRGEGTAGKLLNDNETYERLNHMVDSVDALVKDIKEHPKRYLNFSLF
ncbi:MlaD family protein [Geobacter sp. DSM 9736]|uniref:MlaD family protein n=1 Tax=Geobacter sp. DSM 9736 TaxID=1277350 RepID=UPI000B5071D2|nr:MlaD family protein [Geobacter sp. DSM 9736]SNB47929.1 phospholipid/cholesterol/gamma-HCH transport system substrate-binding protein [Geobacter sp. DSM 9736]